jgi:hypothetical protein
MEATAQNRLRLVAVHLCAHHGSTSLKLKLAVSPPAMPASCCGADGNVRDRFALAVDEAEMLEDHRYLFDLQGFCVVPNVLTPAEVGELNGIVDAHPEMRGRGNNDWVGKARFGENPGAYQEAINATADAWHGSPGFLNWGLPFTRLLDHPRILPYLAMLLDGFIPGSNTQEPMTRSTASTGIRLDRCYGIEQTTGSFRQGGFHQDWEGQYSFERGALRNSLVVVAWNLTDSGGNSTQSRPMRFCISNVDFLTLAW